MNMNENKGRTPLQARQERIQHLKEIYEANKGKEPMALGNLFRSYLTLEGLRSLTIDSYLDYMKAWIATQ